VGALLVLPLLLGGCDVEAGAPASQSSWKSDTDKALGSALSSLGTARLVLDNQAHGRLPVRYVAVSLRDALKVLQTETSGYLTAQPPTSKASENATVVATLQEAIAVLNRAAVAGSSPSRRSAAYKAVDSEYDRVEKLHQKLVGG
jgi:hypothetical protein